MNASIERYTPERHMAVEGYSETADLPPFEVGAKVTFVSKVAEDVLPGNIAVITAVDQHEIYPLTVRVLKANGTAIDALPIKVNEVKPA